MYRNLGLGVAANGERPLSKSEEKKPWELRAAAMRCEAAVRLKHRRLSQNGQKESFDKRFLISIHGLANDAISHLANLPNTILFSQIIHCACDVERISRDARKRRGRAIETILLETKRHQADALKADILEVENILFEAQARWIPGVAAKGLVIGDQLDDFIDISR